MALTRRMGHREAPSPENTVKIRHRPNFYYFRGARALPQVVKLRSGESAAPGPCCSWQRTPGRRERGRPRILRAVPRPAPGGRGSFCPGCRGSKERPGAEKCPRWQDNDKRQRCPITRSDLVVCTYACFQRRCLKRPGTFPGRGRRFFARQLCWNKQPERRLPPAPAQELPDCVLKPKAFLSAPLFFFLVCSGTL